MKPGSHLSVDFELSYDPIQENAAVLRHIFTDFYILSIKTDDDFVKQNDKSSDDINKEFIFGGDGVSGGDSHSFFVFKNRKNKTQLCYNT
jgi:hypothetical protein